MSAERESYLAEHRQFIADTQARIDANRAARRPEYVGPTAAEWRLIADPIAPPRQAHNLGTCEAPACPRTAVRFTPTAKLRVCDDHYGTSGPRARELRQLCVMSCGEDALYPHPICSNCMSDAVHAMSRLA